VVRLAGLALLVGCSSASVSSGPDEREAGTPVEDASQPPPATRPVEKRFPPCEPSFASIQTNVFDVACSESVCHGPPTPAWGLDLTARNAESRLVGQPSASCGELLLVAPGAPGESFLWRKISQDRPLCGSRMPFGGAPLPARVQACVNDWIVRLREREAGSVQQDASGP